MMSTDRGLLPQQKENARHGESGFPIERYRTTLHATYQDVPTHWHEEAELIYCEEGCVRVYLDNVHAIELLPTECAYLEGGKIHRFDSEPGAIAVVIQIDHLYTAFTEPYRLKREKLSFPAGVPTFYQAVKNELTAKDAFSREMIRSAVTAFLSGIYRNEETVRSPAPIRNDQQTLMKELIHEMDEHYRTITFDEREIVRKLLNAPAGE